MNGRRAKILKKQTVKQLEPLGIKLNASMWRKIKKLYKKPLNNKEIQWKNQCKNS